MVLNQLLERFERRDTTSTSDVRQVVREVDSVLLVHGFHGEDSSRGRARVVNGDKPRDQGELIQTVRPPVMAARKICHRLHAAYYRHGTNCVTRHRSRSKSSRLDA